MNEEEIHEIKKLVEELLEEIQACRRILKGER